MRITSVELDNIKSYRNQIIPFREGTTAIRGRNGAGKSTLVQAIGFALFDASPFKQQQQFVREGEKYGTVTVSFVSAFDDREYQAVRRCGTSAIWYIYDPVVGTRVAEQKQDVTDFLRRHLRLEADTDLKNLFNDAVGVPQGTLTADFLMTPENRKRKFDTLLRVEEYRTAAELLLPTANAYKDQRRETERRIDELERETGQLDGWRAQLNDRREYARQLALRLETLQREIGAVEKRRDTLRQAEAEVSRLAGALAAAQTTHSAAAQREGDLQTQLREAEEATRIRAEAHADHEAHLAARTEQARVRQRLREREQLQSEQAARSQQHATATSDLRHTRDRLREAEEAERQIAALAPDVARQGELERERERAGNERQRLEETRRAMARGERDQQTLLTQIAETEARVRELEALRPEAALLAERSERVNRLNHDRGMRTEKDRRRAAVGDELRALAKERATATAACEKAAVNLRKLRDSEEPLKQLPEIERQYTEIEDRIRALDYQLEQHRSSRQLSGGGACPFLGEACLNIQKRGENSLAVYFDRLIATCEGQIETQRARQAGLQPALDDLRTRNTWYLRLDEYEEKSREARERLAAVEQRIAAAENERAELDAWLGAAIGQDAVTTAQVEFKRSDDADKRLREIAPLQGSLTVARERLATVETEVAEQRRQIAALATAPETLAALENQLAALGDPRGRMAGLQSRASLRPSLAARVAELAGAVSASEAALTEIAAALAPFATVEEEERAAERELDRTRPGYTRYLQYEQAAARLPASRQALEAARGELRAAEESLRKIAAAHAKASASFDAEELTRVSLRADRLNDERGQATATLAHTQQEMAALTREIARVEALLSDLVAARAEDETLAELQRMLEQFRDIIREAGPNIMRALLRKISAEANRIFGEILGDRSAQLAWESDYEIVLRRDGKDRTFAQLSGGEQMSAALAVRLALLRSLTRLDIAFFDEPTQNMDGERRGNLAEQIRRVRGFEQLIVISHDDTFEQGLDNVVHVEKRGGETVFVEEGALVGV